MKRLLSYLAIGLITCLLTLTSCSFAPALSKMETQLYTHQAGYHITLPISWQLITEDEQSAVFSAPDDAISLTIISELGGEAYYGLDEIAEMVLAQVPGSTVPWQISRTINDTEQKLRISVLGEDEEGTEVGLDLTILQPYPGMRYYLLFAAGRLAISRQDALIGDIVKNFSLEKDLPYLYTLMGEWRNQELEQEVETEIETDEIETVEVEVDAEADADTKLEAEQK